VYVAKQLEVKFQGEKSYLVILVQASVQGAEANNSCIKCKTVCGFEDTTK
jgi:hypothetical protein